MYFQSEKSVILTYPNAGKLLQLFVGNTKKVKIMCKGKGEYDAQKEEVNTSINITIYIEHNNETKGVPLPAAFYKLFC